MDIAGFATFIGGEKVAGCVIATVEGKRQYVYRDREFTPWGLAAYQQWLQGGTLEVPKDDFVGPMQPTVAIATTETKATRKPSKSLGINHG